MFFLFHSSFFLLQPAPLSISMETSRTFAQDALPPTASATTRAGQANR